MIYLDAKEAKRAYEREWRKKNPDKVRAIKERYWQKKAKEAEEQQKGMNDADIGTATDNMG